jgi:hypothetical protein
MHCRGVLYQESFAELIAQALIKLMGASAMVATRNFDPQAAM